MDVVQPFDIGSARMDKPLIEVMMAHLLRLPDLFLAAKSHMRPQHFPDRLEFTYRAVWQCATFHYDKFNRFPTCEALSATTMAFVQADHFSLPEQAEDVRQFLEWVWGERWNAPGELQPDFAYFLLQRFLHERIVEHGIKQAFSTASPPSMDKLNELLAKSVAAVSTIDSLGGMTISQAMPDTINRPLAVVLPTRVRALDQFMGDGSQPRETNVLLAPSGVGKTLTGIDIACGRAEMQAIAEAEHAGSGKVVVLLSYEEPLELVQPRVWARAAQIHIEEARRMRSMADMSTSGKLKEYESQRFRLAIQNGAVVDGEFERYQAAKTWVNKFLHIADFAGGTQPGQPVRGYGGVDEISRYLDALSNQLQMGIDTVIIDWAGMAVRRELQIKNRESDLPAVLGSYVDHVYGKITSKFNCVTWVLHQIAGRYCDRPPKFKFSHTHAEWCSGIAVNAWFAMTLSTKHGRHCVARCSKARRGEPVDRDIVCHIDGAFGRLEMDDNFVIDNLSGALVARSDVSRFDGEDSTPRNRDLD
jgi:hypothetical protein